MLSCCHSFCTQCIQSLITDGTGTNSLACPSCRQTIPVPNGGVTTLPRNLRLINKQGDIHHKITSNPPPPCDSCSENTSVAYCTECKDLFCKQCWDAHQRVRSSHTHSSFTLEDTCAMSQDKLSKLIPSFNYTCQDHTDQKLKYYCQQCIIPVCIECIIINHKDHPVTEISKQVDSNKATVHESIQGFQVAQQQLMKVLTSGEEMKEKIKVHKKEIDTTIHQTFTTLQQLLHQHEEALLAQSSEVANAKEAHLSLQLERIQHLLETMTYCHSLATSAVREYNDVELLSVAYTIQTRANQLQHEFSETTLEICESPTISVDINTDELTTKIANIGITFNEISPNNTTAVMPFGFAVDKELMVKLISRDSKGRELSKGGAMVRGRFVPVEEKGTPIEAKATDCGDGTYLVSLIPQQLGQHELSLTIIGQPIKDSPFNIFVVASQDCVTLVNPPVQTISAINQPHFVAFSNNDDMFVTEYGNNSIRVYDSSGRHKSTIDSKGAGLLKFNGPSGIAISGDIMYVAEREGHRINKLTLRGDFLSAFGSYGIGKGQFQSPWAICIGPDNRMYVADRSNNRIQVFHRNETFSHIIDCCVSGIGRFEYPYGLSFDRSGYLHVTCSNSNTVIVFTPDGQYIQQYGKAQLHTPYGIAIDSVGNSLVVNYHGNSLSIFDQYGNYIHSIGGFNDPVGVAVASNGSVWVVDTRNNRLVKY